MRSDSGDLWFLVRRRWACSYSTCDIKSWTRNGESTAESWQPKTSSCFRHWGSDRPLFPHKGLQLRQRWWLVFRGPPGGSLIVLYGDGSPCWSNAELHPAPSSLQTMAKEGGAVGGCCCGDCSNGYWSTMLPLLWLVMLLRLTSWLTWNVSMRKRKVNGKGH